MTVRRRVAFCLVSLALFRGATSEGQRPSAEEVRQVGVADVVRNLPEYLAPESFETLTEAFVRSSVEQRDAVVPGLIQWAQDSRPDVRRVALFSLSLVYMPDDAAKTISCDRSLPLKDVPIVAAHLRDSDPKVRSAAFVALSSVETCDHGLDVLVRYVQPMLREPDILMEYPDPFFVDSERERLAKMSPAERAEFKANAHPVFLLPAEGPQLLSILAAPRFQPSREVDDAIIAFVDRPDQTRSTLGESLHVLALSSASERVNDHVLQRVFEEQAMTVFLLQFVADLRLTPAQLEIEKARLIALSKDPSASSALRRASATVSVCWSGDRRQFCKPTSDELDEESRDAK